MAQIKQIKTVELTLTQRELLTLTLALDAKKQQEEAEFGEGNAFGVTMRLIEEIEEAYQLTK